MNKKFIFGFLVLGVLMISLVSAGMFSNLFSKATGNVIASAGATDLTPRIASWWGKVNQHTENGVWMTDPDGSSGGLIFLTNSGKLNYCQKWYPNTIDIRDYKEETIAFKTAGNRESYFATKTSVECVQGAVIEEEDPPNCVIYGKGTSSRVDICTIEVGSPLNHPVYGKIAYNGITEIENGTKYVFTVDNKIHKLYSQQYLQLDKGYMEIIYGTNSGTNSQYAKIILQETINESSCQETDGGIDIYKKGITTQESSYLSEDYCVKDMGIETNNLQEFFCVDHCSNYKRCILTKSVICPNGCSDGACLPEPVTPTTTDVTYQGVLDMLQNNCGVYSVANPDPNRQVNGEQICSERNAGTCVIAMFSDGPVFTPEGNGLNTQEVDRCSGYKTGPSDRTAALCCRAPN